MTTGARRLGALAAAALVSCPAAASSDRAASTASAGWARTDLKPITQPAPVDGALVFYAAQNGGIRVVSLDARTGKTLWSGTASTGSAPPGEPPLLTVVGDHVV